MAPVVKKRVLIGAESYIDADAAIRLAERMAAGLIAELGGMLVSDATTGEALGLPAQRIVTSGGTLLEAPTPQALEAYMERDARAFRTGLSGLARTAALQWAFERRSGELITCICEAAPGWDLLLLGHRTARQARGRVVLIDGAEASSSDAEKIASAAAAALGLGVERIGLGAESDTAASEAALFRRLDRTRAALVVVDLARGPLRKHAQLRRLLEAARCPVLVLNAASAEPAPHGT